MYVYISNLFLSAKKNPSWTFLGVEAKYLFQAAAMKATKKKTLELLDPWVIHHEAAMAFES